jgi:hypothetical protein
MEAARYGVGRLVWLATLTSGLLLAATSIASAQVIGSLTIKGKLYLNGELTKVNCPGSEGNTIDASNFGERIFFIDNSCPLFPDTGDLDEFRFAGEEEQVVVNDALKKILVFSGTEGGTGPALGAAHSEEKFTEDGETIFPTTEKGRFTYSYNDGMGNTVIFVGDFKAKY